MNKVYYPQRYHIKNMYASFIAKSIVWKDNAFWNKIVSESIKKYFLVDIFAKKGMH